MNRCEGRIAFPACHAIIKADNLDILWNPNVLSLQKLHKSAKSTILILFCGIMIIWYMINVKFTKVKRVTLYKICVRFL